MKTIFCFILLAASLPFHVHGAEDKVVKVAYDGAIAIKKAETNSSYISNRDYVLGSVPKDFRSLDLTVLAGGVHKSIKATIPAGSLIYVCLDSGKNTARDKALEDFQDKLRSDQWTYFGTIPTTDRRMQFLRVYKKEFSDATTVEFPGVGFTGALLAASKIEIDQENSAGQSSAAPSHISQVVSTGIPVTPDITGKPAAELREQKTDDQTAVTADTSSAPARISPETIATILREWESLKPGTSTRADVLKIFSVTGGGVGDAKMRTYGYRDCPSILIDVTFEVSPATQKQFENLSPKDTLHLAWTGGSSDKLLSISKPYLGVLP
jgi:hypothetical protein